MSGQLFSRTRGDMTTERVERARRDHPARRRAKPNFVGGGVEHVEERVRVVAGLRGHQPVAAGDQVVQIGADVTPGSLDRGMCGLVGVAVPRPERSIGGAAGRSVATARRQRPPVDDIVIEEIVDLPVLGIDVVRGALIGREQELGVDSEGSGERAPLRRSDGPAAPLGACELMSGEPRGTRPPWPGSARALCGSLAPVFPARFARRARR